MSVQKKEEPPAKEEEEESGYSENEFDKSVKAESKVDAESR